MAIAVNAYDSPTMRTTCGGSTRISTTVGSLGLGDGVACGVGVALATGTAVGVAVGASTGAPTVTATQSSDGAPSFIAVRPKRSRTIVTSSRASSARRPAPFAMRAARQSQAVLFPTAPGLVPAKSLGRQRRTGRVTATAAGIVGPVSATTRLAEGRRALTV